jgi:hypothetical protein
MSKVSDLGRRLFTRGRKFCDAGHIVGGFASWRKGDGGRPNFRRAGRRGMTKAKRAWRKANVYVRSGQHAKAIYWLCRTVDILDGGEPRPSDLKDIDAGYMFVALFMLVVL